MFFAGEPRKVEHRGNQHVFCRRTKKGKTLRESAYLFQFCKENQEG